MSQQIILKNMWFIGLQPRKCHQASWHGNFSFNASVLRSKTEYIPPHKIYTTKYLKMLQFKAITICLSQTSVASKQRTIWKVQKALELKRCICQESNGTHEYTWIPNITKCCFLPRVQLHQLGMWEFSCKEKKVTSALTHLYTEN